MTDLNSAAPGQPVIHTFDWVPDVARGFVRDMRLRWAYEEAGLPYRVETVPINPKPDSLYAHQPFGQVPYLVHGDVEMFESGAAVLHIARQSDALMPADLAQQSQVTQWIFAALNSIEIVTLPWQFLDFGEEKSERLNDWVVRRLGQLASELEGREWLVGDRFTAADLMMADVLRGPDPRSLAQSQVIDDYVARVTSRPAFERAHAAQIALYEQADRDRAAMEEETA